MKHDKQTKKLRGIVHRLDPKSKPHAGDVEFSPDYTVTSTTDGGGQVLTDVEVILCFWGSFWSRTQSKEFSPGRLWEAFGSIAASDKAR